MAAQVLHAVVERVGHPHPARTVGRDAARRLELAGVGAVGAELAHTAAAGSVEHDDPVVVGVGDRHLAAVEEADVARPAERLAEAGGLRPGGGAVAVERLDRTGGGRAPGDGRVRVGHIHPGGVIGQAVGVGEAVGRGQRRQHLAAGPCDAHDPVVAGVEHPEGRRVGRVDLEVARVVQSCRGQRGDGPARGVDRDHSAAAGVGDVPGAVDDLDARGVDRGHAARVRDLVAVRRLEVGRRRLGRAGHREHLDPVVVGVGDVHLVVAEREVVRVEELGVPVAERAEAVAEVGEVRGQVHETAVQGVRHPDRPVGRHLDPLGVVQADGEAGLGHAGQRELLDPVVQGVGDVDGVGCHGDAHRTGELAEGRSLRADRRPGVGRGVVLLDPVVPGVSDPHHTGRVDIGVGRVVELAGRGVGGDAIG